MPTIQLYGIDPAQQPLHETAAVAVKDSLFDTIGYPKLKSEIIIVRNDPRCRWPMYCAGTENETIILTSPGNSPWQYAFQLAHEFAHMSARADLRFPRQDGLLWIEEVLAECHSLISLHHMGQTQGPLRKGANAYLRQLMAESSDEPIDKAWFRAKRQALRRAGRITESGKAISRYICANVETEQILRDNRLLLELETGVELSTYLDQWATLSGTECSAPSILRALL